MSKSFSSAAVVIGALRVNSRRSKLYCFCVYARREDSVDTVQTHTRIQIALPENFVEGKEDQYSTKRGLSSARQ